MVETKEKKIGNMKVSVTEFPGRFGFKMQTKLLRLFGPTILSILAGSTSLSSLMKKDLSNLKISKIGEAVKSLFEEFDDDQALEFVMSLMQSTRVNGEEITDSSFDTIFAGHYMEMYKILGFVLEVNYGAFFGGKDIGKEIRGMTGKNT